MTRHLRFSPEEYRALLRLSGAVALRGTSLTTLRRFLVAHLPLEQLDLAMRIDRLDNRRMRILHEHLVGQGPAGPTPGGRQELTDGEFEAVVDAWEGFPYPVRFLRYLRQSLIDYLGDIYPDIAGKLARLGQRQFEGLYERVKRRGEGSP